MVNLARIANNTVKATIFTPLYTHIGVNHTKVCCHPRQCLLFTIEFGTRSDSAILDSSWNDGAGLNCPKSNLALTTNQLRSNVN